MARTHGKDADFAFDSVALEDEVSSVTLNFSVPEADITAFADTYQNFLAGKPTATIDAEGNWDPASSQGDATIFGELGLEGEEWDFEPDGTTGYNGFAIVTSYSITASVADAIKYSVSFRHNGGSAANDAAAPTRA
jgi:predicted secreted protein